MNKKKILTILMTTFLLGNLASNIVVSADSEDIAYKAQYVAQYGSEPIAEKEVPKSEMTATATSAQPGEGADKVLDGDIKTLWHTPWAGVDVANNPQSITLDLGGERNLTSIHVTPRQVGTNGMINGYKVYSGNEVVAEGNWRSGTDIKYIIFDQPVVTDSIRIEATSSYDNKFVSIAEIEVYESAETPVKLGEAENIIVTGGEGQDLNESIDDVKELEQGTAIVRFTKSGEGIQSLFSISDDRVDAEHFHVYVNGNQLGYELRKETGTVSTGKVDVDLNPGVNTVAFKADKGIGYSIYLNGEKVLSVADEDAAFLSHLSNANSFLIGKTGRTGNEYPMTGKVDFFEIYDAPLADSYLREVTGETVRGSMPVPEGTFKSDPVDVFKPGDLGSPNFRIPAMITTKEGTLISSIDVRVGGGHDSPNNIDAGVKRSTDNGETWDEGQVIIDYPGAASVIDTALLQDEESGRIFLTVTHFAESYGFNSAITSSGYKEIDGKRYLILVDRYENGVPVNEYTVRENGVVYDSNNEPTKYTVDENQNLLKDGELNGHMLTNEGDLKMIGTAFIVMVYSDDDGLTWSDPIDLTKDTKLDWMRFFGTAPGRGHQIQNGEHAGRLVFPIYVDNSNKFQSSAALYSDDGGETWELGETVTEGRPMTNGEPADSSTVGGGSGLEQLTECQVVEMPDGQLKMFMRTTAATVRVATSFDGGATWDNTIEIEEELIEPYCQLSVINYSHQVDGKDAIIFSNPAGGIRNEGTVRIGLINENGVHENGRTRYEFDWEYSQLIKEGYYAYSCLTELENGNIGLFYEGTSNQEMSFTAMDVNYIKADLFESAPAAKIASIESFDLVESYRPGDTANLKVTFNEAVSLIGDRDLVLEVNDVEIPCTVEPLSATEYKLTGVIPSDVEVGEHQIIVKAKEGLEVINIFDKITSLENDIVTESTLIIEAESTKIFGYEDLTIESGVGGDISEVVESVIGLEEGTIVMKFDNRGGNAFQSLLSFSNNRENTERFYLFINQNSQIGIERQSTSGNAVLKAENLTLDDGMNTIAVRIDADSGYSIFVNGVKAATSTSDVKFLEGISGLNTVNVGLSDRDTFAEVPFTGDVEFVNLYSDVKTDEELIELTTEEEVVIVDKSELEALVDSIENLDSEIYTEETWQTLTQAVAIANIILENEEATQEDVDNAKEALEEALDMLEEAPVIYGNIGLTINEEINIGDTTNLQIAINDIEESYDAYAAEVRLAYDESIFNLGDITSVSDRYTVDAGEPVDGEVTVLVASLGEKIVSGENIINVELTAKGEAEASPLVVSGNISDSESSKEITSKTATVKIIDNSEVELHLEALELAIKLAKDISEEDLEDVVPIVVENFKAALEEAEELLESIKAGEKVTQLQVNEAFANLSNAMHMLEHKGDRTELLELVEDIRELNSENYTNESWNALDAVLNGDLVQDILDNENALTADIKNAYDVLFEAFSNLEEATEVVDKSKLQAYVDKVSDLEEDRFKPSTWISFDEALSRAIIILEDENSTQEEVNRAYDELVRAYLELRLIPDKSLLEDLINKVEGLNKLDYTEESWGRVSLAFETAKDVLDNDESTEEEVEESIEKLEEAIKALVVISDESEEDDNVDVDDEELPQTGGVSSVALGVMGAIMASVGSFILRKKK